MKRSVHYFDQLNMLYKIQSFFFSTFLLFLKVLFYSEFCQEESWNILRKDKPPRQPLKRQHIIYHLQRQIYKKRALSVPLQPKSRWEVNGQSMESENTGEVLLGACSRVRKEVKIVTAWLGPGKGLSSSCYKDKCYSSSFCQTVINIVLSKDLQSWCFRRRWTR